jgi:hypothetical protein
MLTEAYQNRLTMSILRGRLGAAFGNQNLVTGREKMTLGLALGQHLAIRHHLVLRESIGETSGDIPLYSLHRIRALLEKQPISVSGELAILLMRALIAANREYKTESGNDWNCLTSQNLVDAIEATDREIAGTIDRINDIPRELAGIKEKIFAKLHEARKKKIRIMQEWFETHFQELLYDIDGKIPWAVVCRLRRNLGAWIANAANPFGEKIEDMILDVAREEGIAAGNAEDAWESMGGTVFGGRKNRAT